MNQKKTQLLLEPLAAHSEKRLKAKEVEYGAMLAISVIAFQVFFSITKFDWYTSRAVEFIALAIPLLASVFVAKAHQGSIDKWMELCGDAGQVFAIIGLYFLLSYLSPGGGFLSLI